MNAVIWATQPVKALTLVGIAFATATALAAGLLALTRPEPSPDEPHEDLLDPATPRLLPDTWDLTEIAAKLNVEVLPDGSVVVHGIPDDLPEELLAEA